MAAASKVHWLGVLTSVQPRIRLSRSFDELSHSYLGYSLTIDGTVDNVARVFTVAIGKAAHAKFQFRAGDRVSGTAVAIGDPERDTVEFHKAAKLVLVARQPSSVGDGPPWRGVPPDLATIRSRGHRRLNAKTYATKCVTCMWACQMPTDITVDKWNPERKLYREEAFCYGPVCCPQYVAGPTRKVRGRKGDIYEEADWVDDANVAHRLNEIP